MKRSICSKWTLPIKVFNVLMWTLSLIGLGWSLSQATEPLLPAIVQDLILFGAFAGFFLFLNHRLKFVAVDEQNLYAARWFKEKAIPLSDLESVFLAKMGFVWVRARFKTKTEFGKKIYFLPTYNKEFILSWARYHPILKELRRLAQIN